MKVLVPNDVIRLMEIDSKKHGRRFVNTCRTGPNYTEVHLAPEVLAKLDALGVDYRDPDGFGDWLAGVLQPLN